MTRTRCLRGPSAAGRPMEAAQSACNAAVRLYPARRYAPASRQAWSAPAAAYEPLPGVRQRRSECLRIRPGTAVPLSDPQSRRQRSNHSDRGVHPESGAEYPGRSSPPPVVPAPDGASAAAGARHDKNRAGRAPHDRSLVSRRPATTWRRKAPPRQAPSQRPSARGAGRSPCPAPRPAWPGGDTGWAPRPGRHSSGQAPRRRGNGRPSWPAGQPGPGLTADGEGAGPGESP